MLDDARLERAAVLALYLASAAAQVTWKGREHWLARPHIVDRTAAADAFDPLMRGLMRMAGIEAVVRFEAIGDGAEH